MYYNFLKNGSDLIFLHAIIKSVYDKIRTYFSNLLLNVPLNTAVIF
jgi:hypothetical protein